ncbi:MAG: 3-hydroxyacyl-ACP dehydratase FabZ [Rhodanobacter sp.]|jgi:3-hydroxyacyl-[acyl-carrier-protein] dehydratase|nr:3-hydroxyacyl-ACP dehydratase FabZ [Rhodanobacter sp.]
MSEPTTTVTLPVNVEQIAALLPHRYPFLLLDRVTALDPYKRISAIKNVTIGEPFFQGHFPSRPVMPGVLIIEAMAQSAGMLALLSNPPDSQRSTIFYLVKVDKARFNRIVVPGDQLCLEVEHRRAVRNMHQFWGQALVDGHLVAEAEMLCAGIAE